MTEPTSPLPPMPGVPPEAPKTSGQRKPFLLGAAAGALVASLVVGGIALAQDDSGAAKHPATADSKPSAKTPKATKEETEDPVELYNIAPEADEFEVTLKTTKKQCFGSAGCNLTVKPELSYVGLLPPDPDKTYSITYEVRGGDDGAVIETMELSDQDSVSYRSVVLSTAGSGSKLTAKVTDVEVS